MKGDPFKNVFPKFEYPFNPKDKYYTIVIIYQDGYRNEIVGIVNPWAYIKEVLKNPKVKECFIKK